jgi:hypothetical protein
MYKGRSNQTWQQVALGSLIIWNDDETAVVCV